MYGRRFAIIAAFLCLTVSFALACGPNFPWQLLDNRPNTFKATPTNSFEFEVMRLAAPPNDGLKAVETSDPATNPMSKAEALGLSDQQVLLVQKMRTSHTGDEAFSEGASVPASVRLYTAGAIDFHGHEMATATQRFEAVLQLPESDKLRAAWAAYMLGRVYGMAGDIDKACAEFQLTRTLVMKGAPDPLGLAVASYGEEARLHLTRAASYFSTPKNLPRERWDEYGRETATAVKLYAEQAASGSASAVSSLRMVAERLLRDKDQLKASVGDPTVQRLLAAYALTADSTDDLVKAIQAGPGSEQVAGADRLAALAYSSGHYGLARKWADKAPGPLSSWVKAKLALQKYDLDAAAAFYAEASRAFPSTDKQQDLDDQNIKLLTGETGALALARGEYVQALQYLYPVAATYWGDVAYIAERVLTADELKRFVDARVPSPAPTPSNSSAATDQPDQQGWFWDTNPALRLRDLLARRLVREGRYREALPYFHPHYEAHFRDPDVRQHVTEYAQALHEATCGWRRVNRARAWYQAAVLARDSGMEMMGYEAAPDYFGLDGAEDAGIGQSDPGRSFTTDGELSRFVASSAKPDRRFHYRFVAVNEAVHAADLLPPRSQAFAAVLCQATSWMMDTANTDGNEVESGVLVNRLYRRYLKEGLHVAWASHFGRDCPQPNFKSAARLPRTLAIRHARHFVGSHRWQLAISLGASLIALAAGFIWLGSGKLLPRRLFRF
jgi:cellulose synthase operon protein C